MAGGQMLRHTNSNSFKTIFSITITSIFYSCQPSSVTYFDPSKVTSTQTSASSCTVERLSETQVQLSCPDGTTQVIKNGVNGTNGINGTNGADGAAGINGTNGADGAPGANGADGKSVEVIDPCGSESANGFDEVLLRLPDRTIISYFKLGTYEHLAKLKPDVAYMTTDDTNCEFKIDVDGKIYDSRGGEF